MFWFVNVTVMVFFSLAGLCCAGPLAPTRLRLEYMDKPLGIDVAQPRFSWALEHTDRAEHQTAYQLTVMEWNASHVGGLKAVENSMQWASRQSVRTDDFVAMLEDASIAHTYWSSGWVNSNQSTNIPYAGPVLISDTVYAWSLSYRDSKQVESSPGTSYFSTGLLTEADWHGAKWLDGEQGNQLRVVFPVESHIGQSFCYVAGLGYYTLNINGRRASDHVLGPFTTFEERLTYYTHDVSEFLQQGHNVLAVTLGNGWYSEPSIGAGGRTLRLMCKIHRGNSSSTAVVSDAGWKQTAGPIVADNIYNGETYDARLETPGWDTTFYNDSSWKVASVLTGSPTGVLSSPALPPIRKVQTYTARKLSEPAPGVFVFDFGQNMAGFCTLTIDTPGVHGLNITLLHAEIMSEDGFVHHLYPRSAELTIYIFGSNDETIIHEPSFVYHGFRYVQMTGYPGVPSMTTTLVAHFVHTDLEMTGNIEFSPNDHILNGIQHITRFASLSNYMDIPTDCPQRERRGWLGDAQLSAETTISNFDMAAAYTKFMRDILDTQVNISKQFPNMTGALPDCVPWYGHGRFPADPAWGVAITFLWDWVYQYYGDMRMLETYYDEVAAHLTSLASETNHSTGLLEYSVHGDWCSLQGGNTGCRKNSSLVSTFYYIMQLDIVAKNAKVLGKSDDAMKFSAAAAAVRAAFQHAFFDVENRTYLDTLLEAQTSIPLALQLGVVPSDAVDGVVATLVENVVNIHDYHMNTGIVGTKYLLPMLSEHGHHDIAMALASQTTFPSWGYMVMQKATTMWESWEGDEFRAVSSRNHIMFGSQSSWYYQYVAGIRNAPGSTGWEDIIIAPFISGTTVGGDGNLTGAAASIVTPRGMLASSWSLANPTTCGTAGPHESANLSCSDPDSFMFKIDFASFGTPRGSCDNFSIFNCTAASSLSVVQHLCLGEHQCSVPNSVKLFGNPCRGVHPLTLAVQATCRVNRHFTMDVTIPTGSTATIQVPMPKYTTPSQWTIVEGSDIVWKNAQFVPGDAGVISAHAVDTAIVFSVGSGTYSFSPIFKA